MAEKKSVRCIIISGSPDADLDFIRSYIRKDDFIICADKGCSYAEKINIIPDIAVGDFDSFSGKLPDTKVVRLNTRKNDTDTEHCASIAIDMGYGDVIILGGTGGRQDHNFANFCTLKYLNDNGIRGAIVDKNETIEVKSLGKHIYKNLNGVIFSVFPFGCKKAVVSYHGKCEYNADHIVLESDSAMGISNIFRDDNVTIEVSEGNILIFIEKQV